METHFRITARVIRDGQPFITEPETGPTADDSKSTLLQWIHECGWEFVAWNDLFQIDTAPFARPVVTPLPIRGNMADKMGEFLPGVVDGQQAFYHVAHDGTVARWWLVPGRYTSTSHLPNATDHPLGPHPTPGWHDQLGRPLPRDPREAQP